jgi:hypothetical protein
LKIVQTFSPIFATKQLNTEIGLLKNEQRRMKTTAPNQRRAMKGRPFDSTVLSLPLPRLNGDVPSRRTFTGIQGTVHRTFAP